MIQIENNLSELGLTEELLLFFHSRTANRDKKIEKAHFWNQNQRKHGDPLSFKVKFEGGGEAEYTMEVAKVRQKRLNLLLMKNK